MVDKCISDLEKSQAKQEQYSWRNDVELRVIPHKILYEKKKLYNYILKWVLQWVFMTLRFVACLDVAEVETKR